MLDTGFSPWPVFARDEIEAVARVLSSGRVNAWTGQEVRAFETEFAAFCRTDHAIAVANGTLALDLALKGLGIGPGDEVIVTPRSFMASASCVVTAGATPVFADVDADSGTLTAATIAAALTPRTRAVILVHLAGWPCDMGPIMDLARRNGLRVIEDCAQAHGASWQGRPVGGVGDVAAWSFCQDKIMTTGGEGGMVTTNDPALHDRMWSFKDHGKTPESVFDRQHPPGFRWVHDRFGTNFRMTEMQAAIGRRQLVKLPAWHAARTQNARQLLAALSHLDCLRCPTPESSLTHAFYRFYAYVRPERLIPGWTRDRIVAEISRRGVPCYQGTCSEIYRERAFDGTAFRPDSPLPIAQRLGETSLMFLVHPTLTETEIARTGQVAREVLEIASGLRSAA